MKYLTTSEQLKKANSSVTQDLKIESLESFVDDAELQVANMLGEPTLAEIELSEIAITILRRAIANFALASYISSGVVQIDDSGIFVIRSNSKAPASDKKLLTYRLDATNRAWQHMEQLVGYMDGAPTTFPEWINSSFRQIFHCSLFSNSGEFSSFGGISISPSLFQILKPQIRRVEDDVLTPNFGEALIEDLRTKQLAKTKGLKDTKLERKLLRIVAPLALTEAIPMQLVSIGDQGVFQASIAALGNASDNIQVHSVVEQNKLSFVLGKLESEGYAMLEQTKKWLRLVKADYPLLVIEDEFLREHINTSENNIYLL